MKKLIALLLAMIMVCGLATVAFADGEETPAAPANTDGVISKLYDVKSGTAPAEDFIFTFEGVSYKNGDGEVIQGETIPEIEDQTITFANLANGAEDKTNEVTFTVNPEDYKLGVYTYKVTEVAPTTKTAGTTYSEEALYLVLTILRDENSQKYYVAAIHYESETGAKENEFTNEYEAGSLKITKEITGNMADMSKEFTFTVTLTPAAGTAFNATVQNTTTDTAEDTVKTTAESGVVTYTFTLGDGQSIVIDNIPTGTAYTVTEDAENYEMTCEDEQEGTITNEQVQVDYVNDLTNPVDTGVALDSAPYIVMLVVAMVGMVALVAKKRYEV